MNQANWDSSLLSSCITSIRVSLGGDRGSRCKTPCHRHSALLVLQAADVRGPGGTRCCQGVANLGPDGKALEQERGHRYDRIRYHSIAQSAQSELERQKNAHGACVAVDVLFTRHSTFACLERFPLYMRASCSARMYCSGMCRARSGTTARICSWCATDDKDLQPITHYPFEVMGNGYRPCSDAWSFRITAPTNRPLKTLSLAGSAASSSRGAH